MKLTVDRAVLSRALTVTARIVERRITIPVLGNLLLRAEGDRLTIKGTDLDIEATCGCAADIARPGATTIPAGTFAGIVAKLPEGASVSLEEGEKTGTLVLKAGRARFTLPTLPVDEFPDMQAPNMAWDFTMPVRDVTQIVAETSFAISTEETRYYLNGVYLHCPRDADQTEGLRAVATDGHRLARLCLPRPAGAEGMPGVILPRKLVAELGKLAAAEGGPDFTVSLSEQRVRFVRDDIVITSKLIDGTFPDYQRVIPTEGDKRVTVARADLAASLDRVTAISSERGRAVKLAIREDSIALSQRNADAGASDDETDAQLDGAPVDIGFNGKYLAEILSLLDADAVEMKLSDPGAPAILTRKGDTALLVVLMPMRV